jgi:hypothetical protein
MPSHSRQAARLAPKMAALQSTLFTLQQTSVGIEPEKALVFELAKDLKAFYTAARKIGDGIEIVFDVPKDITVSDDFYVTAIDRQTNDVIRRDDREAFGGKVYCVLTNAQALDEMLGLWLRYGKDPQTEFPYGKTGLKHVFDCLIDIHPWGYKERIEETDILTAWNEDLQDPDATSVRCEIELFYRRSADIRRQREADLTEKINDLGGSVLCCSNISEISYHAVLADLPRRAVEQIIRNDSAISLLSAEQIMFFRPVGQSVYIAGGEDSSPELSLPNADGIVNEPIVALFDGLPQENHPFLVNRLIIDDPDDYAQQYQVSDRKHGTSMASLIALGNLPSLRQSTHKIYVRPIMKAFPGLNGSNEAIPEDFLLVDKIHESVRRLFMPEGQAAAPTVRIINLSIGIGYRQFDRSISPLARLLDWLSYKYRVLFVVSAGNHFRYEWDVGIPFTDYVALDESQRDRVVIGWINNNSRNMRLLSPSESMNALTVGATFDDDSSFDTAAQILPCSQGMISPISALGKGLNNSIKPDIVYPGGRKTVGECIRNRGALQWRITQREPGTQSAAPTTPGEHTKTAYSFGTSNAAALISHEAMRCYDSLEEVFAESDRVIPNEHIALIIKAMLVHGAEWGILKDRISQSLGLTTRSQYYDFLHRFIGYGKPDIDRAIECAKKRVTLIGYGELRDGEAHLFDLPLPFDFNRERICRRLTVTLTCFTPIVPTRQDYRSAQIWFTKENEKAHLIDSRVDASDTAVTRGSVQHEIFENEEIVAWGEDDTLQLKVNCRAVADEHLSVAVPYAIMVSFEIKSNIDIDVYAKIAEKIRPRIPVQPSAEEREEA